MAVKNEFRGKVSRYVADSEPWFPEPPHPPAGAPNVLQIGRAHV